MKKIQIPTKKLIKICEIDDSPLETENAEKRTNKIRANANFIIKFPNFAKITKLQAIKIIIMFSFGVRELSLSGSALKPFQVKHGAGCFITKCKIAQTESDKEHKKIKFKKEVLAWS